VKDLVKEHGDSDDCHRVAAEISRTIGKKTKGRNGLGIKITG
jgi:hypothetical protein